MLSVHFLSILLDSTPSRSSRHVDYVNPTYLILAFLIKCMLILLLSAYFLVAMSYKHMHLHVTTNVYGIANTCMFSYKSPPSVSFSREANKLLH